MCVYVDGQPGVDLWGGVADATTGRPWESDSVVLVYSSTKGVTSTYANLLIERGDRSRGDGRELLARVRHRRQSGDHRRQLMSHQAGLPLVEGDFTLSEVLAWDPMVHTLAAQEPIWPPGTSTVTTCARSAGWSVS